MKMFSRVMGTALVAVVFALVFQPTAAIAGGSDEEVGIRIGSGVASLFYTPAKLAYAGGGALIAGMAYAASGGDRSVAEPILNASVRGDYLVRPEHIRREKALEFVGRSPEHLRLGKPSARPGGEIKGENF